MRNRCRRIDVADLILFARVVQGSAEYPSQHVQHPFFSDEKALRHASNFPVPRLIRPMRIALAIVMLLALVPASFAQPSGATPGANKRCDAAEKRIAREKKDVATTLEALGRERKARETCATRSGCARIDDNIATLEKRHHRHEVRLVRSRNDALESCRPS